MRHFHTSYFKIIKSIIIICIYLLEISALFKKKDRKEHKEMIAPFPFGWDPRPRWG